MILTRKDMIVFLYCWVCAALWAAAVQAYAPPEQVAEDLRQHFQADLSPARLRAGGAAVHSPVPVSLFYAQRGYRPAWLGAAGPLPAAAALLEAVSGARREALHPSDYHQRDIAAALARLRGNPSAAAAPDLADLDLLLTDAFLTYGSHLLAGRLSPRKVDPSWTLKPRSSDLVALLRQALETGRVGAALSALVPPQPEYARLRDALAQYRGIAATGGWPTMGPGPKLEAGVRDGRVELLRERLRITGDLTGQHGFVQRTAGDRQPSHSEYLFDDQLAEAVRNFQRRHGLEIDGVVGPATLAALNVPAAERVRQIELNMERWRWLPDDLGPRHIVVNIPSFELSVIEGGRRILDARVVVGKSLQPTPVFTANISYLVLDPFWYVPRSIALKEMLPLLRKDPYALFRQNIRIFDTRAGGREVDPGGIDWYAVDAGNFHYRFRQEPGTGNALGGIKFMFPNPYNVYLHDTPARHLFERAQRTFSHGCIRLSKPVELAQYLLQADPRWSRDAILSAIGTGRQRVVRLPELVPIYLLYWTAWVDGDGAVNFRNDIYSRDEPLHRALPSA